MKLVNDALKNALKQAKTQRKGRILVNGNYYDVYNVEYNADAYNDGNVIGNAIASQLDFELPYIEKFNTFKYFDGVWTGSEYEYIDMGTFTVFDEKDEDDFNKHITAFDNLIKFNAPFVDVGGYPKTLFQELQNVCEQAGVVLNNTNIPNGNFRVTNNQFVNEESLKTVLKAICQISGMYAIIKEDKLVLQLKNDTNEVLNKNQHEPVIWKRRTYGINQVVLGMKDVEGEYVLREDLEDIAKNGVHKLVINDNPFAYTEDKRAELIDELFNQVKGFGYVPFEMNGEWLSYLDVGDTITVDGVETLLLRINGKSPKALESVMSAPAVIDSSVDYIDNTNSIENQIKRTEIIVDKQNQEIQALANKIIELSTTETGKGQVKFESATLGALDKLSITGNVKLIYPSNDEYGGMNVKSGIYKSGMAKASSYKAVSKALYPSNDLYPLDTYLIIKQEDKEVFRHRLPITELRAIGNVSDEFLWQYNRMKLIHRVGVATNGDYYVLPNEYEEDLGELEIVIPEGDGYFIFESFPFATISITYMLKNEYTETFATQAQLQSEIKVATDEINLGVSKTLTGYSTKEETKSEIKLASDNITNTVSTTFETKENANKQYSQIKQTTDSITSTVSKKIGSEEVVSSINQSAEEIQLNSNRLVVDSNNFKLTKEGNLTCNNATMNNANVTGGKITLNDKGNAFGGMFYINNSTNNEIRTQIFSNLFFQHYLGKVVDIQNGGIACINDYFGSYGRSGTSRITPVDIELINGGYEILINNQNNDPYFKASNGTNFSSMTPNGVWSPSFNNNSLESKKKNIELDNGCLEEIINSDIASFNWKYEDDEDQKHIGLIITDEGGNYKVSPKVLTHDKDAIDLYSMSGMSWKAIQELYDIIKLQEQKIKELEERLDGVK